MAACLRAIGMLILSNTSRVGHLCWEKTEIPLFASDGTYANLALWSRVNQTSTDGFCGFAT